MQKTNGARWRRGDHGICHCHLVANHRKAQMGAFWQQLPHSCVLRKHRTEYAFLPEQPGHGMPFRTGPKRGSQSCFGESCRALWCRVRSMRRAKRSGPCPGPRPGCRGTTNAMAVALATATPSRLTRHSAELFEHLTEGAAP